MYRLYCVSICLLLTVTACFSQESSFCGEYERNKSRDNENKTVVARVDCVERFALRLSRGSDSAETIAKGVLLACDQQARNDANRAESEGQGKFVEMLRAIREAMRDEALLAVLKARADHCAPNISN